jgi:hypothetical protein
MNWYTRYICVLFWFQICLNSRVKICRKTFRQKTCFIKSSPYIEDSGKHLFFLAPGPCQAQPKLSAHGVQALQDPALPLWLETQRTAFKFAQRGKIWPPGVKIIPWGEDNPQGWLLCLPLHSCYEVGVLNPKFEWMREKLPLGVEVRA